MELSWYEIIFAKCSRTLNSYTTLALFGASERYELCEQFKRFQLSAEEWWAMNRSQRKDYVQKMYALSIDDFYAHQASLYSTKTPLLTSVQLSLPHGSLDLHIAEFMWKKAGKIISQPNSIFPAPSKDGKIKTFSMISETGMSHTVCRFIKTLMQHVHAGILNLNTFARTLLP